MLACLGLLSCGKPKGKEAHPAVPQASVQDQGAKIVFPDDPKTLSFFSTQQVKKENFTGHYSAPASVAVSIVESSEGGRRNTVLFDDSRLNSAYTQFLQHLINISTYKVNLNRVKDLAEHNAATGKEVLDAETQLANEEAAITEQEASLKLAGLDPAHLKTPRKKEVWLVCEVPESQIAEIKIGTPCSVTFTAFNDQKFDTKVDGLGAEVDNITRMVKVRIVLPNPDNRFQVGMFAAASFALKSGNSMSVPMSALVNVQGKDYVFVKTDKTTFERKEILAGQQLDDKVVVLHGLEENAEVVTKGAMQLKGLSFGY